MMSFLRCLLDKVRFLQAATVMSALMSASNAATGDAIKYPEAAAVVSFDTVLALPTAAPTNRFHYGPETSQYAELWLPATAKEANPVVVFVHGGCWLDAYSIDHSYALATALAQEGFAVWNIEYRRVGEPGGGWPGSLADVRAAIAMLKGLEPDGVDLERIVVAGHSAGGHLALLAGNDTPTIAVAPIIDIAGFAGGAGSCNKAAVSFMGEQPDSIPEA